ncbi:MAG TPA: 16S rRNA (cytidine(1402)-2'-O)-methyltransferase [Solirubrobacteraceae bacterium]|jgi:16S rRNA (cytidine1402-2'-O)-methyltransferase|nr:16S rRNA (cytidine(1402)-2'-O)-methyltransferase [Solirubrobacteraceae bacterium]
MTPERAPAGRLIVCPTPLGNLQDITLRALDVLRTVAAIACEDTRRTRVLLVRHGIDGPALVSFHEHNERARAGELIVRIQAGDCVALVSDAGMPLISDPGFALVRAALAARLEVEVLPGPSAVMTALVASGLPAERFRFVGFLPRKHGELERLLAGARGTGAAGGSCTTVAFESPARLPATLAVLAELDSERPTAVCRELTKLHEEVRRGSAAELAVHYAEHAPRGEIVLVIGAPDSGSSALADRGEALAALRALTDAGARARPAARVVAKLTGVSANELYRELAGS